MIPILEFFQKMTHSYGWAIVLLTVLVRILVWPLVVKSTRSMQKMSQLQPHLKAIQARYKDNPEQFQKKAMEFYSKNKINPMGGCLPTLVQLPILFALFATFTGPPFGDRPIEVKVNVVSQQEASKAKRSEVSGANSPYVSQSGDLSKVVVFPGESTVVEGDSIDFGTRAVEGTLPQDFKVSWKLTNVKNEKDVEEPPAVIDESGHAVFNKQGEYHVQAVVHGIAKDEQFGPVSGLGKVAQGLDLLKPANFDTLVLIILFGVTMWLSSKLTMTTPKPADGELDEQQIIQQQTAKTMPIALTAMFFFIPLPTGVYVYMVVSNVIQTLQTWLIMRTPAAEIIDVIDEGEGPAAPPKGPGPSKGGKPETDKGDRGGKPSGGGDKGSRGGSKGKGSDKSPSGVKRVAAVKDEEPDGGTINFSADSDETISLSAKRKSKKKKK